MPELPEVETVMRGLKPALEGRVLRRVELKGAGLRKPFPENCAARLTGRTVRTLRRRGKYILADLSGGETLILHLGMSGRMLVAEAPSALGKHDHVRIATDAATVTFCDPRRFGLMLLMPTSEAEKRPPLSDLGPEPLSDAFDAKALAAALAGKKTPVKAALLDQSVVAGLGNIYVCEVLFRARVSPLRPAGNINNIKSLSKSIKTVLEEAIAAGGSTLRDYRHADGSLGYFQTCFRVYGRAGESCLRKGCPGTVKRVKQGGRSTYYCPKCQK
jgi:formamidopyrimidine-DNA glycosylase